MTTRGTGTVIPNRPDFCLSSPLSLSWYFVTSRSSITVSLYKELIKLSAPVPSHFGQREINEGLLTGKDREIVLNTDEMEIKVGNCEIVDII